MKPSQTSPQKASSTNICEPPQETKLSTISTTQDYPAGTSVSADLGALTFKQFADAMANGKDFGCDIAPEDEAKFREFLDREN
jgi:hypothetical protein